MAVAVRVTCDAAVWVVGFGGGRGGPLMVGEGQRCGMCRNSCAARCGGGKGKRNEAPEPRQAPLCQLVARTAVQDFML